MKNYNEIEKQGEKNVGLTMNEYQEMSKRTMPNTTKEVDLVNFSLGLVCESAEFGDHIKKHVFHGHELDREKAKEELGDALFYAAGLATLLGFTLEEVGTANYMKLSKRYKNGFSKEDSIKRVDTQS